MSTLVTALTAIFSLITGAAQLSSDNAETTTPAQEETNLSSTFEGLSSEKDQKTEDEKPGLSSKDEAEAEADEATTDEEAADEAAADEAAADEATDEEATTDEAADEEAADAEQGAKDETVDPEFSHVER